MSLKYLKSTSAVWYHNFKGDFILRRFSGLNISASKMPDSPAKKAKVEEEPHPADLVQVCKQYKLESTVGGQANLIDNSRFQDRFSFL